MKLSKHFTLAEAGKSQTAIRKGIDNTPPEDMHSTLKATAQYILEPIREWYGRPINPNSWYRGPELNAAIGGAKKSQHMTGRAVDIELPGVPNIDLARWIEKNLDFDQLILEYYSADDPSAGWVHVSFSVGHNRNEILTIGRGFKTHGLPNQQSNGDTNDD